jgi:pre-rRNA-processing protein TSR3
MADRGFPPTIIVVHPRERRSKCTVEPLRDREGFVFWTFPEQGAEPLDGYVRLGIGGPLLSADDGDRGLLVLDGTWRLAGRMDKFFRQLPLRSLPPILTAYPRASYIYPDPAGGLATIEAVYAAYRILGRPCHGLLDDYHWAAEFLTRNQWEHAAKSCERSGEVPQISQNPPRQGS